MTDEDELDFSTILATNAHDMKNSLFMLLQSIENLDSHANLTAEQHQAVADLHYQTSRINGSLMQLLSLYKDENQQLPLYIEENSVADMFEDVLERNRLYLNTHDIKINIEVEDDLMGYFDLDLVTYLIADIFINALRHTNTLITLRAFSDQKYINIQVEDDGKGYPKHMLDVNSINKAPFNAGKGRSGLGLLFAQKIASGHNTEQLQGHVVLRNKDNQGGSLFTLRLP